MHVLSEKNRFQLKIFQISAVSLALFGTFTNLIVLNVRLATPSVDVSFEKISDELTLESISSSGNVPFDLIMVIRKEKIGAQFSSIKNLGGYYEESINAFTHSILINDSWPQVINRDPTFTSVDTKRIDFSYLCLPEGSEAMEDCDVSLVYGIKKSPTKFTGFRISDSSRFLIIDESLLGMPNL